MPALTCEIAFGSGFQTPAASRVWTDVSDDVEFEQGFEMSFGRQNERTTADPNTLTGLIFDNRNGDYTPENAAGANYPDVKLDVPIRITGDPADGSAQVEYLGFINDWGVQWEGSDGYAKTTISASSRLARLGSSAGLKSIVEQAILADSPTAYYTLGEPAGATKALESSGSRAEPLILTGDPQGPLTFGVDTGPGTDGLTAAHFGTVTGGSQYLSGAGVFVTSTTVYSVECFFNFTAPDGGVLLTLHHPSLGVLNANLTVGTDASGHIVVATSAGVGSLIPSSIYGDGATHHIAVVKSAAAVTTVYIDGTSVGTVAGDVALPGNTPAINVGGGLVSWGGGGLTLAHVAVWNGTALTSTQVNNHAIAGLTGYAGDDTASRFMRYAGFAGVDPLEVDVEHAGVTVQHVDTTDKSVVDLLRVMETTEGGVLFDDRDGTLTLHGRHHRLTTSALFTLDMAQHMVESNYAPRLDRTAIANDVRSNDVSGAYTAYLFDGPGPGTSQYENGIATLSIETAAQDDDEPLFQAGWALYKYKDPKMRVPTLSVDCLAQVGKTPNCAAVMAANVGDKITVSNRPSQDASSSATYFVEGYTRVYGPESCVTTFNVSPSSPEDQTYICGHATRGVVGTNPIAL